MSGGFSNPIIGGGGALVYPSIHSPNFVHGSAGWNLGKDGSFEAENAIIRGTITAGTFKGTNFEINDKGAFFYSGTPAAGNPPIASITTASTDAYGNTVTPGVTSYVYGIVPKVAGLANGALNFFVPGSTGAFATAHIQDTGGGGQSVIRDSGNSGTAVSDFLALECDNLLASNFVSNGLPAGITDQLVAWAPGGPHGQVAGAEIWRGIGNSSGITGTVRVKKLVDNNTVRVNINATISTLTSAHTYTTNALPAGYNPASDQPNPISANRAFTSSTAPYFVIHGPSGGIDINLPAFITAGLTCIIGATIDYSLD